MAEVRESIAPQTSEHPKAGTYLERARNIVSGNLSELARIPAEKFNQLTKQKALPLVLFVTYLLLNSGCANTDQIPSMPFLNPRPPLAQEATPIPTVIPPTPEPYIPNPLKYKEKLPDDVVSEQELLEQYHTRIWNTPNVKLMLRRQALIQEPIFKDMNIKEGEWDTLPWLTTNPETGKAQDVRIPIKPSLDIVLIDGPRVRSKDMSEEQRKNLPWLYRQFKNQEAQEMIDTRRIIAMEKPQNLPLYQSELAKYKAELEQKKGTKDEPFLNSVIGNLELWITVYNTDLSKYDYDTYADTFKGFRLASRSNALGLYSPGIISVADMETPNVHFDEQFAIVLAVGSEDNPDSASFVDPGKFTIITGDPLYPVKNTGGVNLGWALRHEFAHREANHPQTDYVALDRWKKAYEAFQNGDDTGFYIVFQTNRGIIVTAFPADEKEEKPKLA